MAASSRAEGTGVKPRSDAYVGLLGISLLALTAAMLFAYLNWSQISATPKAPQMAPAGGGARAPAPPPAPAVGAPGGAPGVTPQGVPGQAQPGANVPPPPAPGNPPPPQKK
jgi:hypothetical protein